MWLKPPTKLDDKWYVRRWMAVTALKVIVACVAWVLCLMSYALWADKTDSMPALTPLATALSFFVPSLALVVGKYMHDASNSDDGGE